VPKMGPHYVLTLSLLANTRIDLLLLALSLPLALRAGRGFPWAVPASPGPPLPPSVAAVARLQLADQGIGHLRAVAVEHAGVVGVEQRILDAGKARALAAFDHDHVLR